MGGDVIKDFGKKYANSLIYKTWETNYMLTPKLREIMCAKTELRDSEEGPIPVPERFKRAIGQVLAQSPDIVTFQELDHFGYFEKTLKGYEYDGVFFQKENSQAGRFNGQGVNGGTGNQKDKDGNKIGSDGAAIFWDSNLFKKIHDVQFDINMTVKKGFNQVCGRVILEHKGNREKIAVYTAHMKSGGSKDKAKKEHQANVIAKHIREFSNNNPGIRILFAADFNCHNKATTKEAIMKEDGSTPHAVFHNTINGKEYVQDKKKGKKNWYARHDHKSKMVSAYKECLGHEPAFTKAGWRKGGEQLPKIENRVDYEEESKRNGFAPIGKDNTFGAETEDYIFFNQDGFTVNSVLDIPEYGKLGTNLLPNWSHPSDHLHILADLMYKKLPQADLDRPLVLETSIECSSCKNKDLQVRRNCSCSCSTYDFSRKIWGYNVNYRRSETDSREFVKMERNAWSPNQEETHRPSAFEL